MRKKIPGMRRINARNTCVDLGTSENVLNRCKMRWYLTFDLERKVLGQTSTFMVTSEKVQAVWITYF